MTMKIDYDELRKRAEDAVEGNKVAHFYTFASMPPEQLLRLLEIIGIAKQSLADIAIRGGRGPEAIKIIEIARASRASISELESGE